MTYKGDDLCSWQRICAGAYIWNDDWLVYADQHSHFGTFSVKHVTAQFRRRPDRERYAIPIPVRESVNGRKWPNVGAER